jgi:hypothetical protein
MSEFDFDVVSDANLPRRRPPAPQPVQKPAAPAPERSDK